MSWTIFVGSCVCHKFPLTSFALTSFICSCEQINEFALKPAIQVRRGQRKPKTRGAKKEKKKDFSKVHFAVTIPSLIIKICSLLPFSAAISKFGNSAVKRFLLSIPLVFWYSTRFLLAYIASVSVGKHERFFDVSTARKMGETTIFHIPRTETLPAQASFLLSVGVPGEE